MQQLRKLKTEKLLTYITAVTCIIAAVLIIGAIVIAAKSINSYDLYDMQNKLAANGLTIALQVILGSALVLKLISDTKEG